MWDFCIDIYHYLGLLDISLPDKRKRNLLLKIHFKKFIKNYGFRIMFSLKKIQSSTKAGTIKQSHIRVTEKLSEQSLLFRSDKQYFITHGLYTFCFPPASYLYDIVSQKRNRQRH